MTGLWRNDPSTPEGKYLVKRRDGTVPEWPYFVIGAKDPCAQEALLEYADKAEKLGLDPQYVCDVRDMAFQFGDYLAKHGAGDPDSGRHRVDDPATIQEMRGGHSA